MWDTLPSAPDSTEVVPCLSLATVGRLISMKEIFTVSSTALTTVRTTEPAQFLSLFAVMDLLMVKPSSLTSPRLSKSARVPIFVVASVGIVVGSPKQIHAQPPSVGWPTVVNSGSMVWSDPSETGMTPSSPSVAAFSFAVLLAIGRPPIRLSMND